MNRRNEEYNADEASAALFEGLRGLLSRVELHTGIPGFEEEDIRAALRN
jgi:hypothetical protein